MKPFRVSLVLSSLLSLGAVLASVPAAAQAVAPAPQNVVQLSASGVVEVPQDHLSLTLSTTREASDAAAVQAQLKAAVDAALAEARKAAVAGQMDVRTGGFSLYPRHNKDGRISAWQGTAELILEGRDFGRISSTAGKVTGLTVSHVAFGLSREERLRVEAQAQSTAIERFRGKASEIARGFGFSEYSLRELSVSSEDGGGYRPRVMAMQAKAAMAEAAPVPLEAGKSTVNVTVSGSVQLR